MRALIWIVLTLVRIERTAFLRGLLLAVLVLGMGVALLSLSGWFILATGAAGLAGLGILFNIFIPSAMVRLLALGRTAARYGERVLTHDATLRALSALRVRLLAGLLANPYRVLERLRANSVLNRVTADVDTLDGALLRLVLPALAGSLVILVTTACLWWLVHPSVALLVGVGYLCLPTIIFVVGQRMARRPSRRAEAAMQAGRSRLIDMIAGRDDLTAYRQIGVAQAQVQTAFTRHSVARRALDRIERRTGAGLDIAGGLIVTATLWLSIRLVQTGEMEAPRAAIGVFAALALAEAVAPVRRALAEIGRMVQAARRIRPTLTQAAPDMPVGQGPTSSMLELQYVSYRRDGSDRRLFEPVNLSAHPGETIALTGPSGAGKSTVLLIMAGALQPSEGRVLLADQNREPLVGLVPQRHALVAGTVAENLRLAAPDASDAALWQALEHVQLAGTIRARGGLEAQLGFRGANLSGGEGRRLALARAVLLGPGLLLLDEPTEGLDDAMAREVMAGLRAALPDAAIVVAAHRPAEVETADCVITIHWRDDARAPC